MIVLFINVISSRNISSKNIFLDNSNKEDILFLLIFIFGVELALELCSWMESTMMTYMQLEARNGSRII